MLGFIDLCFVVSLSGYVLTIYMDSGTHWQPRHFFCGHVHTFNPKPQPAAEAWVNGLFCNLSYVQHSNKRVAGYVSVLSGCWRVLMHVPLAALSAHS